MPRVSVLLTCYNHVRHLKTAIECLRSQTYRDFEVVALDDGSTDGTREWLVQLKEDDPGFPLALHFNESNLGTYGTLNRGIEASTGELIAIFNDDDVWAPTKLEMQVAMMDAHPEIGLVHTGGHFVDADGAELLENPLGFPWPKTGTGDVLQELVPYNKIIASSALVRRACFDAVGVFNTAYFGSGDWEMWCRIAERYHVGHIDADLTLYRVHGGSASQNKERIASDDLRIRKWMVPRIESYEWPEGTKRRMLSHCWACIGTGLVWVGEASEGRSAYLRSLRLTPWRFKSVLRLLVSFLPARAVRALK